MNYWLFLFCIIGQRWGSVSFAQKLAVETSFRQLVKMLNQYFCFYQSLLFISTSICTFAASTSGLLQVELIIVIECFVLKWNHCNVSRYHDSVLIINTASQTLISWYLSVSVFYYTPSSMFVVRFINDLLDICSFIKRRCTFKLTAVIIHI